MLLDSFRETGNQDFVNNDKLLLILVNLKYLIPIYESNYFDDVLSCSNKERNQKWMAQYYSDKKEVISKKMRIHYNSNYENISEKRNEYYRENWKEIFCEHIQGFNEDSYPKDIKKGATIQWASCDKLFFD